MHPFPVPEWKWECISMDFITWFPITWRQHDSIMVVVDKLTNESHFFPWKMNHILYWLSPHIKPMPLQIFSSRKFLDCMDCLRQSFLIGIPSLLPIFGRVFLQIWVQSWNSALYTILRLMDIQRDLIKFLKTCFTCMWWKNQPSGRIIYTW